MLIFWEQRLVFLATPKAGSTAVEVALEPLASLAVQHPPQMKHADAARFNRHIHPWLQDMTEDRFTTVALMREPVEWLRSWYRFHLRDYHDGPEDIPAGGFEGFVGRYIERPKEVTMGIGTQSGFLGIGSAPPDRIFRYEDMQSFTRFLEDRLGCEINLPRINVPPAADVTLSDAATETLHQTLEPDFTLYASLP